MRKIKIKKDSDGNIELATSTNKMAAEKSAKKEPSGNVRISELLVEVDRTDVGRKLI